MRIIFSLLMLLPLLTGCLTEANQGKEADAIVAKVHTAFQQGDFEPIMPLYDEQFLRLHSADRWRQKLIDLTKPLGKLNNIRPTFQQKDPRFRGDFYLYGFLLQYEHGTISETLTIYKGVDKDKMTITGHDLRLRKHP